MQKLDTISHKISSLKQAKSKNVSAVSFKSGDFPYAIMHDPLRISTYEEVNSLRRKDKVKFIPLALGASAMILTGCGKQDLSKTTLANPDVPLREQVKTPVPELVQAQGYIKGMDFAKQGANVNECYKLVAEQSQCIQGYNAQTRGLTAQSNRPAPATRTVNQQTQPAQTGSLYRIKPQQPESFNAAQPSVNRRFARFRNLVSGLVDRANSPQNNTVAPKPGANIRQACENALPSTVTIYSGEEIGSGSFVSPEYVITNRHVIEASEKNNAKPMYIHLNGQDSVLSGEVVKADPDLDLALVRITAPLKNNADQMSTMPTSVMAAPIATSIPNKGEEVCAIGSPFGSKGRIDTGKFSQKLSDGKMESDLKLQPGNSGGPLLNIRGELVGVNKSIWQNSDGSNSGISYSVPAPAVRQFINQGISTK